MTSAVVPPSSLPQDLFLDFDAEPEMNGEREGEELAATGRGEGEREGAASPQFSTTSTVSGDLENTNPFSRSTDGLEQNGDNIPATTTASTGDTVVATTTKTWERFEPVSSNKSRETSTANAGHTHTVRGGTSKGATASPKQAAQSGDETGAVCAADSSGWTALGADIGPRVDEVEIDDDNLPFRQTRSMRATTNRKVQIVDALKQQRRLSNTSLELSRGGGPFANEDELSRRYNVEREWQVFVKMNKRVPGTR